MNAASVSAQSIQVRTVHAGHEGDHRVDEDAGEDERQPESLGLARLSDRVTRSVVAHLDDSFSGHYLDVAPDG